MSAITKHPFLEGPFRPPKRSRAAGRFRPAVVALTTTVLLSALGLTAAAVFLRHF